MTGLLTFAVLGLGLGATYALLAEGVVFIYRGSGVVNFAQGGYAFIGAVAYEVSYQTLGPVLAMVFAILAGALSGLLTQELIMRPLRHAVPLVRVVATLGLLVVIQSAGYLHYASSIVSVPQFLPNNAWDVGGVQVQAAQVTLFLIAAAITVALTVVQRRTLVGLATLAVAENDSAAATLGWSPRSLANISWSLGGALAGAAGALILPLTGLLTSVLTLLILPALAASVLGRFESPTIAFLGACALGVGESVLTRYWAQPGISDAVPFVVIIIVLVVSGRSLPLRGHVLDRLPRLGSGVVRPVPAAVCIVVAPLLFGFAMTPVWLGAFTVSLSISMVMLSVVVLTGYAGQISLAQSAMAGLGAFVAGHLEASFGWAFLPAALVAILVAIPIGLIFAMPALRTRGVNLAVITLGVGVAVNSVIFSNLDYTGGINGINVNTKVFGFDFDGVLTPVRYTLLAFGVVVVTCLVVANLRRSSAGRRLIAIRENERAAASMGISVVGAKLYAFAVSSAIAALGGVLIAFRQELIDFSQFDPFDSIYVVSFAVIGGLGYIVGPMLGSLIFTGGVASLLSLAFPDIQNYLPLIGGAGLVLTLLANQDGLVQGNIDIVVQLRKLLRRRGDHGQRLSAVTRVLSTVMRGLNPVPNGIGARTEPARVEPRTLEVKNLTVRFGGVTAVQDVSFSVQSGEVVGLIGPNGAGKTTVIEAVSGFVQPAAGTVKLGDSKLLGRSAASRVRAGVARSWQSLELLGDITVAENIGIAAEATEWSWRKYFTGLIRPGKLRFSPVAQAAIVDFGLEDVLTKLPGDLSYGQRRLVGIARAIASNPSVLLLDEPAAGLSSGESRDLGVLIRRLADTWGMGVLLVEHDVALVMAVCDRAVVLNFGSEIAVGTPQTVANDPDVVLAYLGEPHELPPASREQAAQ
jgi:ABC-type branched-subunit amino acid transport system ATPase component/branched-subunit amino acid ABC-type transport system permease component